MKTIVLLALINFIGVSTVWGACRRFSGAEQIWSNPSLRFVFIGEVHGSNETPAALRELLCDALVHGRHVTVALERPSVEQADLDRVVTAKDASAAVARLLRQPGWRQGGFDGRASKAMLRLLLSLREFQTPEAAVPIFAFDVPSVGTRPGVRDEAMGNALLAIHQKRPQDLILVLTGNAHAFQAPTFGYRPAAMYLPQNERLSLEVTSNGGQSWADIDGACGVARMGASATSGDRLREIVLDPHLAPFGKVDGILSLGVATTASSPAVGKVSPSPLCRKKFVAEHHDSSSRGPSSKLHPLSAQAHFFYMAVSVNSAKAFEFYP